MRSYVLIIVGLFMDWEGLWPLTICLTVSVTLTIGNLRSYILISQSISSPKTPNFALRYRSRKYLPISISTPFQAVFTTISDDFCLPLRRCNQALPCSFIEMRPSVLLIHSSRGSWIRGRTIIARKWGLFPFCFALTSAHLCMQGTPIFTTQAFLNGRLLKPEEQPRAPQAVPQCRVHL